MMKPLADGMMGQEPKPESTYDRIYAVVRKIPRGKVSTYGRVAEIAGLGRAARQVGYAMAALPDHTTVPWHRVVNAQGRVSLRTGGGGELEQRFRLEAEGVTFDASGRIPLARFAWSGPRKRKRADAED